MSDVMYNRFSSRVAQKNNPINKLSSHQSLKKQENPITSPPKLDTDIKIIFVCLFLLLLLLFWRKKWKTIKRNYMRIEWMHEKMDYTHLTLALHF